MFQQPDTRTAMHSRTVEYDSGNVFVFKANEFTSNGILIKCGKLAGPFVGFVARTFFQIVIVAEVILLEKFVNQFATFATEFMVVGLNC
jgi:hypothetical protein